MSICVLTASATNCGSFIVSRSALRSAVLSFHRHAGRRKIDAAERLGAEDQAIDLPVLLRLGVVVDMRDVLEVGLLAAAELDDRHEVAGLVVVAPERFDRRHRQAANAVHLVALDGDLDAGGARIARHDLHLDAEQILDRQRGFHQRAGRTSRADDDFLGAHLVEFGDACGFGYAADGDALFQVADPGELRRLESRGAVAHQRLEGNCVHERRHHGPVFGGDVVEPVGGGEAAGADHVLHDDRRTARDVTAEMPL